MFKAILHLETGMGSNVENSNQVLEMSQGTCVRVNNLREVNLDSQDRQSGTESSVITEPVRPKTLR